MFYLNKILKELNSWKELNPVKDYEQIHLKMQLGVIFSPRKQKLFWALALSWKNESPNQVWDRDQILEKKNEQDARTKSSKNLWDIPWSDICRKKFKKILEMVWFSVYYPSWSPEQLLVVYQHMEMNLVLQKLLGSVSVKSSDPISFVSLTLEEIF